jgi:hypothetical protein
MSARPFAHGTKHCSVPQLHRLFVEFRVWGRARFGRHRCLPDVPWQLEPPSAKPIHVLIDGCESSGGWSDGLSRVAKAPNFGVRYLAWPLCPGLQQVDLVYTRWTIGERAPARGRRQMPTLRGSRGALVKAALRRFCRFAEPRHFGSFLEIRARNCTCSAFFCWSRRVRVNPFLPLNWPARAWRVARHSSWSSSGSHGLREVFAARGRRHRA